MSTGAIPTVRGQGLLRVVSPQAVTDAQNAADAASTRTEDTSAELSYLAGYIRTQFDIMRSHRSSAAGWNARLLEAQRMFNGEYDPTKLAEIKRFGGSDVYARVAAVKCRGASALLRDIYLQGEAPWGLEPTPEPVLPDDVISAVQQLVQAEMATMQASGAPVSPEQIRDRTNSLIDGARRASIKKAREEAKKSERKLADILVEGQFYDALAEFLVDLPIYPFACIKGPMVRIVPTVKWQNGQAVKSEQPRMFWQRVSPFDVFFTPGVTRIEDAAVIERVRYSRADLNALLDLPGYNQDALRAALKDYANGLTDFMDPTDQQRADSENRESPVLNRSGMIDGVEFHGSVLGSMLLQYGLPEELIPAPERDYFVQAWVIGRYVIKVQLSPSPRKRHPYYITSFEKVPGTPVGNALPSILGDVQDVCNAALRALVNNMSISSGPQVVVDVDQIAPNENPDELYPWKRWRISADPTAAQSGRMPVTFFQPNSNAQELLGVYEKMTQIADELSAIPRYATGSERLGGAGRTASGLAMLMGNASKVLQNVAGNIDREVVSPLLSELYDMVMLTDTTGILRGDENIRVRGVAVAIQRETNRQRQLEFLNSTANPIDMQIMGVKGRAAVLRSVSNELGMDGVDVVPGEEDLAVLQKQNEAAAAAQPPGGPGTPGGPAAPGAPGQPSPPSPSNQDMGVPEAKTMRGMS
jgi:hypothetical protein